MYLNFKKYFNKDFNKDFIIVNKKIITYSDFYKKSFQLKVYLKKQGLQKGSKILVKVDNCIEYLYLYLACILGGFIICPVNPSLSIKIFKKIKKNLSPDYEIDNIKQIQFSTNCKIKYKNILLDNNFLIIHTSGTTGDSKGILFNVKSIFLSSKNFSKLSDINKNSKVLHHLPMYYMSGILNSFFSPFFSKSKIVLLPKTSSRSILNFWEDCLKYNVNYINLTPSMCVSLHLIFKGNKKILKKIGYIKNVIVIGSTLSEEVKSKFYKKFKIRLRQCYGITECGGPITVEKKNSKLVNSSGICGSTTRIKIIENIDGLKTINVKNDFSMKGYYSFNKLSYGAFENGYFDTNDVGIFENKNLFVYGRVKEIIKKNSELVFPNLLDNFFLSNNQILETKTIGIYDKNSLEKIVSFISLSNTLIAKKVLNRILTDVRFQIINELGNIYNPDKIILLDSIPKTENNKIDYLTLKNLAITKESL